MMNPAEFANIAQSEQNFWWYRGMRRITFAVLDPVARRRPIRDVLEAGSRSLWGEAAESWRANNLVGTPEQVAEKMQTYRDLGCEGFVPWCSDYPGTQTLELLATKVIPNFRP